VSVKKKQKLKLRDVKPAKDPTGGRHRHHNRGGDRPNRPDPPSTPGGL